MPGVYVDSQSLRDFAARLKQFSDLLNEEMTRTQGQMGQLGDSWKDEGYEEFKNAIAKTFPMLRQLIEESNQTVPKLLRDAEAVDEFTRLKPE